MKHKIAGIDVKHTGWATLSVACIRLPDGKLISREVEDHGVAVAVLPYDPDRKTVIVVEQFRPAPFVALGQEATLEAIAGIVEGENDAEAARREALEEAGLRLRDLERVGSAWTMPGISTERLTLYLAAYRQDDRVTDGGGVASEDENIRVIEMRARGLRDLMDAGDLVDMKTLALTQALQLRHPELFS
ncbi:MAG: NUDIX hydrolase [Methylocystis sp.]|nr:MAG: NUDIX hydrolase [Methylocystis sp.]